MLYSPEIWLEKPRKVSRKSRTNYRCQHFSPKTRSRHVGESLLEHYYCLHLDRNPSVRDYRSHPASFGYFGPNGKRTKYSPDKLVVRDDGQWIFVEIKPRAQWVKNIWQEKFKFLKGLFHSIDTEFVVVLDDEINRQPQLSNLKLLNAYANFAADSDACREVTQCLKQQGPTPLKKLVTSIPTVTEPYALIYHLLHHNTLDCDMHVLLGNQSIIELTARES